CTPTGCPVRRGARARTSGFAARAGGERCTRPWRVREAWIVTPNYPACRRLPTILLPCFDPVHIDSRSATTIFFCYKIVDICYFVVVGCFSAWPVTCRAVVRRLPIGETRCPGLRPGMMQLPKN